LFVEECAELFVGISSSLRIREEIVACRNIMNAT